MTQSVTVPFVTLGEVKEYLQINSPTYDTRLSNLIHYACSVVESYIGREIKSNVYTETFDGGVSQVFVSRLPINSVKSVTEFYRKNHLTLHGPRSDGALVSDNFDTSIVTATTGASLNTRRKKFGRSSLQLNGDGGSLFITDPDSNNQKFDFQTDDFTIEGFFRTEILNNTKTLISRASSNTNYMELTLDPYFGAKFTARSANTEVMNVYHTTGVGNVNNYYGARNNTFSHYAVSKQDGVLRLFVNGDLTDTQNTNNSVPSFSSGTSLFVGKRGIAGEENYFKGYADEIRVTIDAKYAASFTPTTYQHPTDDNTVVLLHLDGSNNSTTIRDDSRADPQYIWDGGTGGIKRYIGGVRGTPDISVIPNIMFKDYPSGIKVTYDGGYTTIPRDIKVATLDYIKILHKQTQENAGFSLSGESGKQHSLSANFPPHIRRVLEMYRIVM